MGLRIPVRRARQRTPPSRPVTRPTTLVTDVRLATIPGTPVTGLRSPVTEVRLLAPPRRPVTRLTIPVTEVRLPTLPSRPVTGPRREPRPPGRPGSPS